MGESKAILASAPGTQVLKTERPMELRESHTSAIALRNCQRDESLNDL